MKTPKTYPVQKSEAEWRETLDAEDFRILREKGTEYPFTGKYNDHFDLGHDRHDL